METLIGLIILVAIVLLLRELQLWWNGTKRIESAIKNQNKPIKKSKRGKCSCGSMPNDDGPFCSKCGRKLA